MTETSKATPRPWQLVYTRGDTPGPVLGRNQIDGPDGRAVLMLWHDASDEAESAMRLAVRAVNSHDALVEACEAALGRMEAVASGILVEKRAKGVSQAAHVRHMAGHLEQHAKIFRAAITKTTA